MKVSLNWVKEFTAVKVAPKELLDLIGERLGAIDEVAEVDGDLIIDIENKMFTHRPDCFGMLGIAREIAGIQHLPFKSPDWYLQPIHLPSSNSQLPLDVRNDVPQLVPRFMAVAIDNIRVAPSPAKVKSYLVRAGIQPVNSVVDITNYMMLLTGQPLHAYDYDKLAKLDGSKTATLVARKARKGEQVHLLNGKQYQLREGTVVIASRKAVVGIGGVMGAKNTEVDEHTRRVVIECANFDMYAIRHASMAHGIFTDAVARFNKGQSPAQTDRVLAKAVGMIRQMAGGQLASKVFDLKAPSKPHRPVKLSSTFVNERLGLKLSAAQMQKLLTNAEFEVKEPTTSQPANQLTITPPFWRTDIHIPEDIVEEIGRLHGYGQLPLELPKRDLSAAKRDSLIDFKHQLRELLSRAGANEVLTYSFVHGDLMRKVGQDSARAYRLSNALSPELQYYRMSLLPSLLNKVHPNIRAGYAQFALFEIGKAHIKGHMDQTEPLIPAEEERLALVITDKNGSGSYYQVRAYLAYLLDGLRLDWQVENIDHQPRRIEGKEALAPFEQKRSGYVKSNGELIGFVGEFKPAVQQALKLPPASAGLELDVLQLLKLGEAGRRYRPLPEYPKVSQDMTLKVPATTAASKVQGLVESELVRFGGDSRMNAEITAIYQSKQDKAHRNITFSVEIANYQRTLTTSEVNDLLDTIASTAKKQLKAERI